MAKKEAGPPPKSLADELEAMPSIRRNIKTWIDKVSPEIREAVSEIRERYRAGKLDHLTMIKIHEVTCERLKVNIGRCSFSKYMDAKDEE